LGLELTEASFGASEAAFPGTSRPQKGDFTPEPLARASFDTSRAAFLGTFPLKNGESAREMPFALKWTTNDVTAAYEMQHPGASLRYGFIGGKLAAVALRLNGAAPGPIRLRSPLVDPPPQSPFQRTPHEELARTWSAWAKLGGDPNAMSRADEHLSVRFMPYCSPAELFWGTVTIIPAAPRNGNAPR
jgi:hypothetical protein